MAMYLIGDVQGCDGALQRLLDILAFSPSRDTLYILGDLVNRGPASAAVLRRMMVYGDAARCILGNHDLHLLAIAHGARSPQHNDTLEGILAAPDRAAMLDWLQHQPLARQLDIQGKTWLLVHAGVLPQWSASKTLTLAREVETLLQSPHASDFFHGMYRNTPTLWDDALTGIDRLRTIVNALTRLRFCTVQGEMEFKTKEGAAAAPDGFLPWFDVPGRATQDVVVAFGHWSTLGRLNRDNLYALDTGCVWGGKLSALRLDVGTKASNHPDHPNHQLIQVDCKAEQQPGR
ncbi:MAG: symmetrical bis(5'-nucleosyl)-tetraphosphatase [Rhodoferax sp.]|nr:symmetrical bis(5'-nucleosyl)-tetraphosphatase [Rhodoferax sp.]